MDKKALAQQGLEMIDQKTLKEILLYDESTGVFRWAKKSFKKCIVGSIAGHTDRINKYTRIQVNGVMFKAHRLAWLYVYGELPQKQIDHINRIRSDNRICNLRLVTNSENMQNISKRSDNTSGHKNVHWHKASKKWQAYIMVNQKQIHIGLFSNFDDAVAAYTAKSKILHKFSSYSTEQLTITERGAGGFGSSGK